MRTGNFLDVGRLVEASLVASAEHFQELTSTNDVAKGLARQPDLPLPYLVVAEHQTAGRGRGTHRWWTGSGSLAFSVILNAGGGTDADNAENRGGHAISSRTSRGVCHGHHASGPSEPSEGHAAEIPLSSPVVSALAAGLAVHDAVRPFVPLTFPLGLHWPNDVYVGERKLSGTLVETANGRSVVGIGVNVNNRSADGPAELRDRVISIIDLVGVPVDRGDVLEAILRNLWQLLRHPISHVASRADALCLQKGRELEVDTGSGVISGVCRGIDALGRLELERRGQTFRCVSGTVRRRTPA